ncbi:MAG: sigma 54-interacting transcriptional regulator [Myxococcales bacterium]|nr:sigma 54-interacting transcriptional regulator [Myxococcales bacterium]
MGERQTDGPAPILISWVNVKNDPYDRDAIKGKSSEPTLASEPGPTLNLLFDPASPYCGKVREILFLHRHGENDANERRALQDTITEIERKQPDTRVHRLIWKANDPTDYREIFAFLRDQVIPWRRRHAERPVIIHISPGTPAMQTVWVLMAETGLIPKPFDLVKSYRRSERRGQPAVVPVEIGIETFYKAYLESRPWQSASPEQAVGWDPAQFRSPQLKQLYVEAGRIAQLNVPVLILGERGTGKTTLASWLRQRSRFRKPELDASWPAIACGQYSPETMRAELFGYKKGAFTGASQPHDGLLASAHEDTLFLDEIGDISRDLQRLLIKAVEEKRYQRLGETKYRHSEFRLLCATNLSVKELRQRLAPDFWDRVSVFQLRLPALRDIPDDLDWLWEQTYAAAARRAGVSQRQARLGQEHHHQIIRALRQHRLPGNLRDLLRVAYHLVAARSDEDAPIGPSEAVEYALTSLTRSDEDSSSEDRAQSVARAFAENQALDGVLGGERLHTKDVLLTFKRYMGRELRRIASARRVRVDDLCEMTERALYNWENSKKETSD